MQEDQSDIYKMWMEGMVVGFEKYRKGGKKEGRRKR
jgi:hypothetical protein